MGSQFPPEVRDLLWKLNGCHGQARSQGFNRAAELIRSAAQEIEDQTRLNASATPKKEDQVDAPDGEGP